ncbi:unnamed protein product [Lampetra fluviatilis]
MREYESRPTFKQKALRCTARVKEQLRGFGAPHVKEVPVSVLSAPTCSRNDFPEPQGHLRAEKATLTLPQGRELATRGK